MGERVCACCGEVDCMLYTDHNHRTGQIRARVCPSCNSRIGKYESGALHSERYADVREYLRKTDPDNEYLRLYELFCMPPRYNDIMWGAFV